jgi:hypothetical protein
MSGYDAGELPGRVPGGCWDFTRVFYTHECGLGFLLDWWGDVGLEGGLRCGLFWCWEGCGGCCG